GQRRRSDEILVVRGGLIVPAHAVVHGQVLVDLPVVLDIDAELLVGRGGETARGARIAGGELHPVRLVDAGGQVVIELRVGVVAFHRVDVDRLVLHAHLHGVAVPAGEGEVVLDRPALLALVLVVGAGAGIDDVADIEPVGGRRFGDAENVAIAV